MSTKVLDSISIITLLCLLLRWCVSMYPYSGAGKPPMFGDYEAQRHWQEITVNLKVSEWYTNSSSNDLQYWGLDYPPLTAYHSYLNGLVARAVDPRFVALKQSRGFESPAHKLFMRYTVLLADIVLYIPAAFFLKRVSSKTSFSCDVPSKLCFLALLWYPGIVLIDHGHFQYNNVSLGLFVAAVAAISANFLCLGSFIFSLALNYKQMELYHALPFFCYLLGKCYKEATYSKALMKLIGIGVTVILTFAIVWAPYLDSVSSLSQVVNRVFPLNRGLFEDKVASVWCSLSVLIKFKNILDNSKMALVCLGSTALLSIPSCSNLLINPTIRHLKYTLVNVSLVFFLFSYHVHEKSILLVTIPACLLYGEDPRMVSWLFAVSQLSMLPLLDRDGLFGPCLILTVLVVLMYRLSVAYRASAHHPGDIVAPLSILAIPLWASAIIFTVLTLAFKFIEPPHRFPDLFPVLTALFSCAHFVLFTIYFHYRQFMLPDIVCKTKKMA